jgi:polyisoprenyl-teichoic acid--peptidoglycan teichoic acid transferase
MERSSRGKKKRLRNLFISLIVVLVLASGIGVFAYNQLKPANHFKAVPTFNTNSPKSGSMANTIQPKQGTMNILLLGSDEHKGKTVGHSDSIILMHIDFNTNKINAVSIPRDTRVHLDGYGYTKLTSVQYIKQATSGSKAGIQVAANSISELTGIPINYYVETNYEGLQSMVDSLGSINVNVPFDVKLTHPWYKEDHGVVIKKGQQNLNGKMVTELVHERYSLPHGDYDRQLLQEKVLVAIAKTGLKPSNITKLPSLIQHSSDFLIGTNMSNSDLLSFGLAMKNINPNQITYYQLNGHSQTIYDDILKNNNSEIILDQTKLKNVMLHFK